MVRKTKEVKKTSSETLRKTFEKALKKSACVVLTGAMVLSFVPGDIFKTISENEVAVAAVKNGWIKEGGSWYYYDNNVKVTGWKKVSGKWFYMNSSGVMVTGWQKISNKWYYFATSGVMVTGWQKISNKWYYFATSGVMVTGWQSISGKKYYFGTSGAMQTGWLKLSNKWYYFGSSGAMVSSKWVGSYYLKSDGTMAISEWVDNGQYYVGADGKWIEGYSDVNTQYVNEVIRLVNVERNKQGLPSLTKNETLCKAADKRADEVATYFSHTRPSGESCFTVLEEYNISYWYAAENIAVGQRTPAEVMNSWMNSEGHRNNILNSNLKEIGVGYEASGSYGTSWVQLFIG